MKFSFAAASVAAVLALAAVPAVAQTSTSTKVTHDTSMNKGVATHSTKVVHTAKRKTRRPKKILGVKVGHKTVKTKVVRESSVSSNGDVSNSVKTTH